MQYKDKILKVAEHLQNNRIDEETARNMLLALFGVTNFTPLSEENLPKILKSARLDTWIACKGSHIGFNEWYKKRCTQSVNKTKK